MPKSTTESGNFARLNLRKEKMNAPLKFDLEKSIKYLEFWKPIDGHQKIVEIWFVMGTGRIHKAVENMGHNLDLIDQQTAQNIINKAFRKGGITRTRDILLAQFKKEQKAKEKAEKTLASERENYGKKQSKKGNVL